MNNRGQILTLEAVISGMIILFAVVVTVQSIPSTSITDQTTQQIISEGESRGEAILNGIGEENLKQSVLYWNVSKETFHNTTTEVYYTQKIPDTKLGKEIKEVLIDEGYVANIKLIYYDGTEVKEQYFLFQGEPTDSVSVASKNIALFDSDKLYKQNKNKSSNTLSGSNYFIDDQSAPSKLYAMIEIKVIIWRP